MIARLTLAFFLALLFGCSGTERPAIFIAGPRQTSRSVPSLDHALTQPLGSRS